MEFVKAVLTHWFFWGFILGFVFCVLSMQSHWKTKRELKKLKGHISDKLEIEADNLADLKKEKESLKQQNENLRIKVKELQAVSGSPAALTRELEIYARAEKSMMIAAPGFAPAWEKAKSEALAGIESEEAGKTLGGKILGLFTSHKSGGESGSVIEALPAESSNKTTSTSAN